MYLYFDNLVYMLINRIIVCILKFSCTVNKFEDIVKMCCLTHIMSCCMTLQLSTIQNSTKAVLELPGG